MEWISVEDRLPNEGKIVLAYVQIAGGIAWPAVLLPFLDQGDVEPKLDWAGFNGQRLFRQVTHWMPLPDAPKD